MVLCSSLLVLPRHQSASMQGGSISTQTPATLLLVFPLVLALPGDSTQVEGQQMTNATLWP